jgi:WD40 repeat protein
MSAAPLTPQHVFAPNPSTTRATATPLSSHGTRLVYTSGRSVVLRDLASPTATLLYAQHAHAVSVARISPSGYYCASGDVAGNVRVWDLAGGDMVLKLEKKAPGPVRDIAWDAESKRIAAVGDGKER